jgi:HSP20 family protein
MFTRGRGSGYHREGWSMSGWNPACEVYARDGKVVVCCDLPGVDPADVNVRLRGRVLTIAGARRPMEQVPADDYSCREIVYGTFERRVHLPAEVEAAGLRTTHRHGTLIVEAPIAEGRALRTVPVTPEVPALAAA